MCTCGCQTEKPLEDNPQADPKSYLCVQCNTFKKVPPEAPAPECCGKKMEEMD
jgi:hypothetical protein